MATDVIGWLRRDPWASVLRITIELGAWISIYFAWGVIPMLLAVAALVLFNVPGDRRVVLIRVPGPLRIVLELIVMVAGIVAAFQGFGILGGALMLAGTLLLVFIFSERLVWLLRQRP
ncbi:MAG: hypothetical protein ACRELV_00540 [Longimicrobiales bacterium]